VAAKFHRQDTVVGHHKFCFPLFNGNISKCCGEITSICANRRFMPFDLLNVVWLTSACHLQYTRPLTRCKYFYVLTTTVNDSVHTINFHVTMARLKELLFYGFQRKGVNCKQHHASYKLISILRNSTVRRKDDMFDSGVQVLLHMHIK